MMHQRYFLSIGFIFLGALGLLLSLLGEVSDLGKYTSSDPRIWESFDQKLVDSTPDYISLQNKLDFLINQSMSEQEKMFQAYYLVTHRFTHTDEAKYNPFSNWLLWLMGKVYSPFAYIRQPEVLVKLGHSSLCSEQAYLLQTLAESQGIRTRSVGLNGHVVMEAWYDNDWHLYDPDLEVVPLLDDGRILSLDELARQPEQVRHFYQNIGSDDYVNGVIDIVSSREDNSFVLYWMVEKHLAYRIEKIANILKWFIPMFFLLTGLGMYFIRSGKH